MNETVDFGSLISSYDIEDLTDEEIAVVEHICAKMAKKDGSKVTKIDISEAPSVTYGREDMIADTPELTRIGEIMEDAVCHYLLDNFPELSSIDEDIELRRAGSWMNVYRDGERIESHTHDADVSAVLYFDDVAESEGGELVFLNPVNPHLSCGGRLLQERLRRTISFQSRRGALVVFPSYLEHFTTPYLGENIRRIVAADFTVTDSK